MNWGNQHQGRFSGFHMNGFRRRANANVYYSPGVDRLFAVDTFDPYTSLEIAQILSSKMPAIAVLILHKDEILDVTNLNCINYTLKNKNPIPGQAALLFSRQMPVICKLTGPQLVLEEDFPLDFQGESLNTFLLFHEYAKFVIWAWHSAKICDMTHNLLPMAGYRNSFLSDIVPQDFQAPADNTNGNSTLGITAEIKRILYFSDNIEQALESLAELWRNNTTPLCLHWRRQFYTLLQHVPEPEDLQNTKLDLEKYSGYLL